MRLVPPSGPDPVVAALAERLCNPSPEDEAAWRRFAQLKELVANAETDIGPLSEDKRQLLGLYLLNARWIGQGVEYEARPGLERPRPALAVVSTSAFSGDEAPAVRSEAKSAPPRSAAEEGTQ